MNEGQNRSKSHKNRCPCLSLKWVSKSTLKFQFRESWKKCIFLSLVWTTLNGGQNSSQYHKNRCPCLSLKWIHKSTFKPQFWESKKSAYFQPLFDQPWMRDKIAPNILKIGLHAYLSNGYLNPLSKLNSEKDEKSTSYEP